MDCFKRLVNHSVKPDSDTPPRGSVSAIHVYACNLGFDFAQEQEVLAMSTWPNLREFVRMRYGCDLQVLHSGSADHLLAGEERYVRSIQDEELISSEMHPLKPVFVVFLGQKYANCHLPERIAAETFIQIHNALRIRRTKQAKDFDLLETWYYADERDVDRSYRLHDPTHLIPDLLSEDVNAKLAALDQWKDHKSRLLRLFRLAIRFCAKGALSDEINTQLLSALPSEFDTFLKHFLKLKERGLSPNLVLVTRRIYDLHNYLHVENVANFTDIDECDYRSATQHFDSMFQARLAYLNQQFRDLLYERSRDELHFDVLWKFPGGIDKRLHDEYLVNLSQRLLERLCAVIDSQVVRSVELTQTALLPDRWLPLFDFLWTTEEFLNERLKQQTDQDEKIEAFISESSDRDSMVDQIVTGENIPYFVLGKHEERHETIEDVMLSHIYKRIRDAQPDLEEAGVRVMPLFYAIPPRTRISRLLNLLNQHVSLIRSVAANGEAGWQHTPATLYFPDTKQFVSNLKRVLEPIEPNTRIVLFLIHAENLVEDVSTGGARHRSFTASLYDDLKAAFDDKLLPAGLHVVFHACIRDVSEFMPLVPSEAVQKAGVKANVFLVDTYTHHDVISVVRAQVDEARRQLADGEWDSWLRYVPNCRSWQYAATFGRNLCESQYGSMPLLPTFDAYLDQLFGSFELRFGRTLVEHVCVLIALSESGLNDQEMVDLLSLDEPTLDSVLRNGYCGGVRRLPTHVWLQVKRCLQPYLLRSVHSNGLLLFTWKSEEIEQFVHERYVKPLGDGTRYYSQLLAAYFSAFWYRRAKPFEAVDGEHEARRYVPSQPVVYSYQRSANDPPTLHFNFRKIEQLPRHLLLSGQLAELNEQVLFNYQWLLNKCKAISIDSVVEDLENTASRETHLLAFVLKRSRSILERNLDNLSNELIGFLLPYTSARRNVAPQPDAPTSRDDYLYPNLRFLIDQCDLEARSCFLPAFAYANLTVNYALIGAASLDYSKAVSMDASPASVTDPMPKPATPDLRVDIRRGVVYSKYPHATQIDVFDLRSGQLLHTIPASCGRLHVDAECQFGVTIDDFQNQIIKLHALHADGSTQPGQLVSHVVPLNAVELAKRDLETKQQFHVVAFDIQRTTYCCVLSSDDASYVCVGHINNFSKLDHFMRLEGHYRAALCQLTQDEQVLFCSSGDKLVSYDHLHETDCKSVSTVELQAIPIKMLFLSDAQRGFVICERETKVVVVHSYRGVIDKSYKVVFDHSLHGDPIEDIQVSRNELALLVRSRSNLLIYDINKEIIRQHLRRPTEIPTEFKLPNSNDYVQLNFTSALFALDDRVVVASIFRDVLVWNAQNGAPTTMIHAPVAILSQLMVADLSVLPTESGSENEDRPCVILGYNGLNKQLLFWNLNRAISEESAAQVMDSLTSEISFVQVCEKSGVAAAASIKRSDELGIFDLRTGYLTDLYTHEGKIEQVCLTNSADYTFVSLQARRPNTSNLIWSLRDRRVIAEFENRPARFIPLSKRDAVIAYFTDQSSFGRPVDFELIGVTAGGADYYRCRLNFEKQTEPISHLLSPRPLVCDDEHLVFVFAEAYNASTATYSAYSLVVAKLPKWEGETPPAELTLKMKKLSLESLLNCTSLNHIFDLHPVPKAISQDAQADSPAGRTSPQEKKDGEPTISFYLQYTRAELLEDGTPGDTWCVDLALVTRREEDRREVWRAPPVARSLLVSNSLPVLLDCSLLFSNTGRLCVTPRGRVVDLTTNECLMTVPTDWHPLVFLNSDQIATTLLLCSATDPSQCRLGVFRLSDAMLLGTIDLHSRVHSAAKYAPPGEQNGPRSDMDRMVVCGCEDGSLVGFAVIEPLISRNQRGDIVGAIASRGSLVITRVWDKVDQSQSISRASSYARAPSVQRSARSERDILHELPTSATPSGKSSRLGGIRPISGRVANPAALRARSADCAVM